LIKGIDLSENAGREGNLLTTKHILDNPNCFHKAQGTATQVAETHNSLFKNPSKYG